PYAPLTQVPAGVREVAVRHTGGAIHPPDRVLRYNAPARRGALRPRTRRIPPRTCAPAGARPDAWPGSTRTTATTAPGLKGGKIPRHPEHCHERRYHDLLHRKRLQGRRHLAGRL